MPLLKLRSDEQLVALFRQGHEDAFRVIHDRYRQRLFAYTRQMLPGSRQDAEDALQDVFVRAYSGLRANDRDLALRAWLYRVAHNRCIDELRRPVPVSPELIDLVSAPLADPFAEAERRDSLRRLIADVRRLPEQQRSALLMRELSGMRYAELADVLGVSVPAVKSLLVRARVSLAQAAEARDTACSEIREELILAHDRGMRPAANSRRHLRDCPGCRQFRREVRGVSRQLAAFAPTVGPAAVLANLLGVGGTASGAAVGGGVAVAGSSGMFITGGIVAAGTGHIATLLAAVAVTAGGAVGFPASSTAPSSTHRAPHGASAASRRPTTGGVGAGQPGGTVSIPAAVLRSSVTVSNLAVSRTVPTITRDVVMRRQPPVAAPVSARGGSTPANPARTAPGPVGEGTPAATRTISSSAGTTGPATSGTTTGSTMSGAQSQDSGASTTTGPGSTDAPGTPSSGVTSTGGPDVGTTTGTASGSTTGTATSGTGSAGAQTAAAAGTSAASPTAAH